MNTILQYNESKDTNFADPRFDLLMRRRVRKVLIYCSNYDFFMLEEDGRIDEQVFDEYVQLNLREPPLFIQASNRKETFRVLRGDEGKLKLENKSESERKKAIEEDEKKEQDYNALSVEQKKELCDIDLVITMLSIDKSELIPLINDIRKIYDDLPIVALTPFSREVSIKLENTDLSAVDYIFSWLGDAEILLAIIKLIEDKKNLNYDVEKVGVQTILLVEDSVRFYSSYLPIMYKIVLKQARIFMMEGLNEHREMLLMRGRPKILLATNYEDAIALYKKYSENMIGIISDIAYMRNGEKDPKAGFKFVEEVLKIDEYAQCILQSSNLKNKKIAEEKNIEFLYKHSRTLNIDLAGVMFKRMAFGDFVFRDKKGNEVGVANNLRKLQDIIKTLPDDALTHHFNRNDFSRWLNARALFTIAQIMKPLRVESFREIGEAREFIYKIISNYRLERSRGVIAKFDKKNYDKYLIFSRIGSGSLGGKARGLAFIDSFLKRSEEVKTLRDIIITIPRTVVLSTDVFDDFMKTNNLYRTAYSSQQSDEDILDRFVSGKLSKTVVKELKAMLKFVERPLAIRSSSVLEDSHYQPFAGIYSTYMIPNIDNPEEMTRLLTTAIKSVYASVYYKSSKAYMEATSNMIAEEKMAIIIQEVCGSQYDGLFYPHISGVARSINFYPIPPEKNDEGIAKIAFGLGKTIVDGGVTLRFSPQYPKKIIQLSSPQMALRSTQKQFYALDMDPDAFVQSVDDSVNIKKIPITDAEDHGSLKHIASTYDMQNQMMRDGINYNGKKLITFANVLKNNKYPLTKILALLLKLGKKEMNNPIEIEFAVDIDTDDNKPKVFHFLQIRPIVENYEDVNYDFSKVKEDDIILHAKSALGNGEIRNVRDFVYVKPESFTPSKTNDIARFITKLNERFVKEKKYYVLVGPGRWGSSDPWLGIPVKWPQISHARLITEAGLPNFRIDPSQGTHFFQNLTSFRVGYFTINPYIDDGAYKIEYLDNMEAVHEDKYIRHIRFEEPLLIRIDGKRNEGVVCKPGTYFEDA